MIMGNQIETRLLRRAMAIGIALVTLTLAFTLGLRVSAFADEGRSGLLAAGSADGLLQAQSADALTGLGSVVRVAGDESGARFIKADRFQSDSVSSIVLPSYANTAALELCYGEDASSCSPAFVGTSQQGPFAQGPIDVNALPEDSSGGRIAYVKPAESGEPKPIRILKSANVNTVFLTSADPVSQGRAFIEASSDHSAQTTGQMLMADAMGKVVYDGALTQIKGRGNATWTADKKPYQIKLDKKTALLGGDKSNKAKTWVLLANAYDETAGLRNYVALRTALAMGLTNSPECDFVDLYYDGEYRGLYLLCEKVQINTGRIEIDEIENVSDNDVDLENRQTWQGINKYGYQFRYVEGSILDPKSKGDNTGGYLLEVNVGRYGAESNWFMSSIGAVEIKSPDYASYEQVKYISERFQAMVDVLTQPDGNASAVVDLPSLSRTYLVNEFAKNFDYMHYSTFFYLPKNSAVFYAGPVWDFDLAFGVFPYRANGGEYVDVAGYASQSMNFFSENKAAVAAAKSSFESDALSAIQKWVETAGGESETIDSVWGRIATPALLNDRKWGSFLYENGTYVMFGEAPNAVAYLASWISDRIDWMSQTIPTATTLDRVDFSGVGARAAQSAAQGESGAIRLWGQVALDTMNSIIDRGQFDAGSVAVLVTAEDFPDALTAAGVAGMANAPIIMTSKAALSAQAQEQLAKLQPQTIIVCGGEAALPPSVADAAAQAAGGAQVERLWGAIASDTAVNIFNQGAAAVGGKWARTAFVCTASGYWDALAASPISYATGMPIFLADNNGTYLSDATMKALKENISSVYIVGGETAVAPSVVTQLNDAGIPVSGRLWGETAIGTSSEVATFGLAKGMNVSNVGVATIEGYWDALAAAPFCGRMNAVMVLAGGPGDSSITEFLAKRFDEVDNAYVFGGQAAISDATYEAISTAIGS